MSVASSSIGRARIPRTVWALGFVSLFMDISSEMIHALLPVFLVSTLGASTIEVGLIEGIGEGAAPITKIFSGAISDWLGRRKLLAVIGYGLGALSKPIFAMAGTPLAVLGARFADRVGKGIRGAPRDALVADVTPPAIRGAAYGLRQSLDTIGAFSGPLLAIALMALLADNIRTVFWIALIPGAISVALLVFGVEEPARSARPKPVKTPVAWGKLGKLGGGYWAVVAVGIVFTFARFSEAFLVLRGQGAGIGLAFIPVVLIVMNVVYALTAWPAGSLSDRMDRRWMLAVGLAALIASDLVLASWATIAGVLIGAALWGLHMGFTQGLFAAMVADTAPEDLRGTAFGLFNLLTGLITIAASFLAGFLWQAVAPWAPFVAGAVFSAVTIVGMVLVARHPAGR